MPKFRALASARDLCSRPTPYRILERVAGIAFNFSSTELNPANSSIPFADRNPSTAHPPFNRPSNTPQSDMGHVSAATPYDQASP
jgi:hypothetical protein